MAASQLGLYNAALRFLGERRLASLEENREPRFALDGEYPDATLFALEEGFWTFAMRGVEIYAETSFAPTFGYQYAFAKPGDWVRTYQVSAGSFSSDPMNEFKDEAGFWFANINPIFFKYVSSDPTYGMNITIWPQAFAEYVAALLAYRVSYRLVQSKELSDILDKKVKKLRHAALAKDAMNNGTDNLPLGSWVMSRGAGSGFPIQDHKTFGSSLLG